MVGVDQFVRILHILIRRDICVEKFVQNFHLAK